MEPTPQPARKAGLETPLGVRFLGESAVSFSPSPFYDVLVFGCLIGGPIASLWFLFTGRPIGFMHPFIAALAFLAVTLAGLWALFSSERMVCHLRTRSYVRLEGQARWKTLRRGTFDEFDALVLTTEKLSLPTLVGGQAVVYRLVLHWKQQRAPLLVVERKALQISGGAQLNDRAGPWVQKGMRVASALGVPFYDNSYFHSPCPIPTV